MIIEEQKKTQQELMEDWLAALRSGEYRQGTGGLYVERDHAYCCLGIADVVCFDAVFEPIHRLRAVSGSRDDQGSCAVLSPERARVLGLDYPVSRAESDFSDMLHDQEPIGDTDPKGDPICRQSLLAGLNDRGVSFVDIANYIERMGWTR